MAVPAWSKPQARIWEDKAEWPSYSTTTRYLVGTPPAPVRWRRRLIGLGSRDPTRAICSRLIARAFESIRYPVLPEITLENLNDPRCANCYRELLYVRRHSLFAPRDFDVSPYFAIVKPGLSPEFDFRTLEWAGEAEREAGSGQ